MSLHFKLVDVERGEEFVVDEERLSLAIGKRTLAELLLLDRGKLKRVRITAEVESAPP